MKRVGVSGGVLFAGPDRSRKMVSAPEYRQIRCLGGRFEVEQLGLNVGFGTLRRAGFSLVIANHFSKTAFRLALSPVPYVFVNHNGFVARPWLVPRNPRVEAARSLVIRRARRVIALSKEEHRALGAIVKEHARLVLLPNVLEDDYYAPRDDGARHTTDVLFVGHFTSEKGLPVLLEAVSLYEQWSGRDLRVRCIGFHTAEQEAWLRRLTKRLDLRSEVTVRQGMSLTELVGELKATGLYVLPSFAEAQSTVLEEAVAVGTPVLSSAVGAAPDLLPPERLFSPGGSHELATLLLTHDSAAIPRSAATRGRISAPEWCRRLTDLVHEAIGDTLTTST